MLEPSLYLFVSNCNYTLKILGKIQTWSAVVISGLKPATKQSQVPHGNCRPKSNSILKENIEDGSRGSLETIPNNASLVEHTLYTRQTAPFGSPLDNFLSYKRSPQSRSSEKSQVQRDGCQDTALSFIEDKSLSTKIATGNVDMPNKLLKSFISEYLNDFVLNFYSTMT